MLSLIGYLLLVHEYCVRIVFHLSAFWMGRNKKIENHCPHPPWREAEGGCNQTEFKIRVTTRAIKSIFHTFFTHGILSIDI